MNTIIKKCVRHGELIEDQCKKVIEKRWGIQPNYKYICKQCIYEHNQTYLHKDDEEHQERIKKLRQQQKIKHREKLLEGRRKRSKINRDKLNLEAKRWRQKNLEKHRENGKNIQKKWRDELNDNYIKAQLSSKFNIPQKDIPEEWIEVKRAVIKLRRKIREIEK